METFTANDWESILPDGWSDRSMITLVGNVGTTGIASNIVVTREKFNDPPDIRHFAEKQKQGMAAQFNNVELLDERETTLNDMPAYQLLQKFTIENITFQQAQTFVLGRDAVFVITATAGIQDFNRILTALRQFTENFRLTNV